MNGPKRCIGACKHAPLATTVKHSPFKRDTQGSSPWRGTWFSSRCGNGAAPDF